MPQLRGLAILALTILVNAAVDPSMHLHALNERALQQRFVKSM